jgi:hypothetical protein
MIRTHRTFRTTVILIAAAATAACSADAVRRGVYEAGVAKQCERDTGVPGCQSPKPTYDDYRRERDKAVSP